MPFSPSSLVINAETCHLLSRDRALLRVLLVSSLFWFLGGVVQPSVNAFGKTQMLLGDSRTSLLAACLGVGIAVGCILAGVLSRHRIDFRMVHMGAWGVVLCLAAVTWLGAGIHPEQVSPPMDPPAVEVSGARGAAPVTVDGSASPEPFLQLLVPLSWQESLARVLMIGVGLSAGLFIVPLQVFMQSRPPHDQKGRMIGAMNLINWIGIVLSAAFYWAAVAFQEAVHRTGTRIEISWIFAALALLFLPVAVGFRPRSERLD
jgi:acyl-[acyl-carrier-protein]-phospholipid O-acyltransferase/long-chain-fatty-acid--[acyl-carrier-protein] ligase